MSGDGDGPAGDRCHRSAVAAADPVAKLFVRSDLREKTSTFFGVLSLCVSQACLGNPSACSMIKPRKKDAFYFLTWSGAISPSLFGPKSIMRKPLRPAENIFFVPICPMLVPSLSWQTIDL
jgi:hypothetical protein